MSEPVDIDDLLPVAPRSPAPRPRRPLAEILAVWGIVHLLILVAKLVPITAPYAKAVAAVAFLYVPAMVFWRRKEDHHAYGAHWAPLGKGLRWGLGLSAVVLPLYALFFAAYLHWGAALVPAVLKPLLYPYPSGVAFHLRLPDRFLLYVLDQFLVVALPEEFFYRGYMQKRLKDRWSGGPSLWGVTLGPAFWLTQILFAVGHLVEPYPWRLAVFFPALLFGFLREKVGSVVPSTIFHALSNLTMLVLQASFFGF